MSGRWYKRCGRDFIHGTMGLSLEEKGAYSLMLDLIYDHGGPIADDARWLAGVCGISVRKWSALRERLISIGKMYEVDGRLSNVRADSELESAAEHARERAETGAKGGRKSAETRTDLNKNSGLGKAKLKREEEKREEPQKDKPSGGRVIAHRLSTVWEPPPETHDDAARLIERRGPEWVATELAKFRDHFASVAGEKGRKLDWHATWRNWLRRADDDGRNSGRRHGGSSARSGGFAEVFAEHGHLLAADLGRPGGF